MKKFFALLLVAVMLLPSIVACGETEDNQGSDGTTAPTVNSSANTGATSNKPSTGSSDTKPGTDDSQSGTDVSKPSTDDSQPGTDVSKPGTDDSQPGTDESKPGTDESKPGTDSSNTAPETPGSSTTDSSKPSTDDPTTDSSKPSTGDSSTTDSSKPSTGDSSTTDSSKPSTGDSSTTDSSKPSTGDSSTTDSSKPGSTSSSTPGSTPKPPVTEEEPPVTVTKWSGKTVNILATIWAGSTGAPWSQVELTVGPDDWYNTAGFGQIINAAVLRRADEIKKTYGVSLNWINSRSSQISTLISEAIVGGSSSTQYHIAMPRMMEAQTIVATNGIYDLANRQYIDLDKSYYNQVAREAYTVYDRTLFAAGDFSFLDEQTSYLIYYNVAMTTGFDNFPDLYQMVKDGKWTIDQMTNIAMLVKKNEGDAAWTDDDTYGFGTSTLAKFFQYSGIQQVTKIDNEYKVTLNDPKVGTLIDKILVISNSDWARSNWDGGFGALQKAFEEGRLLFYNEVVQKTDYFTNQTDEFKVGILPTPMLSDKQDKYYTPCSYQSVVMCIPKATPDRQMSDYFFEILSYTGQKHIMSAYKENLKAKLDAETATESMEIIENYIFSNLCYDVGYMEGWNGLLSSVQTDAYSSGKNNFGSVYQDAAEDAMMTVEDWNMAWLDYNEE